MDIKKTFKFNTKNQKNILILVMQAILVGIFAGLIVCFYRFSLTTSESFLFSVLHIIKGNVFLVFIWLAIVSVLGYITGKLMEWEPSASGSGIPQVDAEINGYIETNWWKILVAKISGGTLSTIVGISLGREGPSVQLGAMAGKGVSKIFNFTKTKEFKSIIAGSAAGLSATFSTPLAGVVFALEQMIHFFDREMVLVCLISAIVSDYISKLFFGQSTIFHFPSPTIPLDYYWILVILGIILGFCGYIYNTTLVAGGDYFKKIKGPLRYKFVVVFLIVGIVSLVIPQILDGGHMMISLLYIAMPSLGILLFLVITKYLLTLFSFSSGAPGGIFFPILVIGAYIGAIFGSITIPAFGLEKFMIYKFIIISMVGFFTATVRAPITGVILVSEMVGSVETLVAALIVCIFAYFIPTILNNDPIYTTLFKKIIDKKEREPNENSEKILREYPVPLGSPLIGKKISQIPISKNSIIVSVTRKGNEMIAYNDLIIKYGDTLHILMDYNHYKDDNKEIFSLLNENNG